MDNWCITISFECINYNNTKCKKIIKKVIFLQYYNNDPNKTVLFSRKASQRINPNQNNQKRDAHNLGKQIAYVVFILNEVNRIKK